MVKLCWRKREGGRKTLATGKGKKKEEQSGDALVVYLREESVHLACTILDESQTETWCLYSCTRWHNHKHQDRRKQEV